MTFNLSYNIVSFVFLSVVCFEFFRVRRYPVFSNRLYGALLILGDLALLFDTVGSLLVRPGSASPVWLAYLVNICYYMVLLMLPAALISYLLALIENKEKIDRMLYVYMLIPAIICLVAFFIGMPMGLVFRIDQNLVYSKGPLAYVTYTCLAIYLAMTIAMLVLRRDYFSYLEKISIGLLCVILIIAAAIQFMFPSELLTGSATALSFMIMYFTIQNPQLMIDGDTGLFNANVFTQMISPGYVDHNSFHAVIFRLHDLHNIFMLYGRKTGNEVLTRMGGILLKYRNASVYLTDSSVKAYQRDITIENVIRKNLQDGENFRIFYQPIYSVRRQAFASAEALVRYRSEEMGVLYPGEFIPIIEGEGLATELDEMVVKKVFSDIRDGAFSDLKFINVHINLSAASLASEATIAKIIDTAEKYSVNPGFVVFEITETAAVLSEEMLKKCANRLRGHGFGFALDDFGSGYANVSRLSELPFTHVKLDRVLVQGSRTVFREMVGIFNVYHMMIVAEGAETEEQISAISEAGIDMIQGFYYSKPAPLSEMRQIVKHRMEANRTC